MSPWLTLTLVPFLDYQLAELRLDFIATVCRDVEMNAIIILGKEKGILEFDEESGRLVAIFLESLSW